MGLNIFGQDKSVRWMCLQVLVVCYIFMLSLYSLTVFHGIGTGDTEPLIRLLNNAFDIMNGRCLRNAIFESTWSQQSQVANYNKNGVRNLN